jgi:hypothetical protein
MSLPSHSEDDPRPSPPEQPSQDDCCQSGCNPCIFDLYYEEVGRWRAALAEWEAREAARQAAAAKDGVKAGGKKGQSAHDAKQPKGPKAQAHGGAAAKHAAETSG